MTVRIAKPSVNIREKLAELERPIGLNGQALLATETPQQAFDLLGARNRNRVINGDMRIDQRNAGASVTASILQQQIFTLDRWCCYNDVISKRTIQRSAVAPVGFTSSLSVTIIATDTVGPQQFLMQVIEGYNISDFAWGTSSAIPITLSFWVRSSVTGQHGGSIQNNSTARSFPFAYTINSTNTWEYKTINIAGETSGTWVTDNGVGLRLLFEHGPGYQKTTAGSWVTSNTTSSTGSVNLCATNGATWYITGVQLEVGKVATPFEYRSIGEELALCQRYYEKSFEDTTTPANGSTTTSFITEVGLTWGWAGHRAMYPVGGYLGRSVFARFKVPKRVTPTVVLCGNSNGLPYIFDTANGSRWVTANWGVASNKEGFEMQNEFTNATPMTVAFSHWTASAEL